MEDLLDQIDRAAAAGLHYVALWCALSVPDICGALGAPNGQANGPRYRRWWDEHLPGYSDSLTGEQAYAFRNSLLHQGRARHSRRHEDRIFVQEPGGRAIVHKTWIEQDGQLIGLFMAPALIGDITEAGRAWLRSHRNDPTVKANLDRFVRRHSDGFPPFIVGLPIIG